ncbi:aldo/keto reductase family oxidoreductase [Streptococcus pneumoniae]|jgi:Predicted oxidoreductase|uniref:Oxidoreductase, aldo/keto reductase family n=4 Tax=Streptococcus pneumoniae TaxID=1313 RepID=A0A0H2UPI9_STRPN|nr:aldo/keto reductase family oxidoreductase [Streptococcus pneumoniae]EGI83561.1 aldo/keto reductase family protein [Streptococcus pneumoniae GA17570]EGJ18014.1 aldo/keto reductase family protein [Streptococcus pneumoniae GA47368]EGJ18866.1 aldo/keto reductase family protein [Streptococcus pneumoniae GA47901]EHD47319.1 aldo/keto reductase family protein [Streptococcus pneumoniae GA44452]EHD61109.1 aldo/keto reductase family protein [Streptococcus pneumoniae GA41410]EHD65468.1 aldo/keto reduc
MRYITLGQDDKELSEIVLGMMRIKDKSVKEVEELVETALSVGINAFDLADIYGRGRCEELLGLVLKNRPDLREKMWIQSKCGIRIEEFTYFDFSKDYIIKSVDGILQRLKIDHLDSLLLHRPDALMESDQVAEAFNLLYKQGKVRDFGVSNQNPMMMELLKKDVKQPLAVNQLQLSAAFTPGFESAFHVNMEDSQAAMRDGSIFEYCQLHDVVIQAWSVLQFGYFKGNFVGNEKFQALNQVLDRLAIKYGVTSSTIAISWILRYPAKMQAVVGTTNPKHLREVSRAANFSLTRKEWYEIYLAAGNNLP